MAVGIFLDSQLSNSRVTDLPGMKNMVKIVHKTHSVYHEGQNLSIMDALYFCTVTKYFVKRFC